MAPESAGRVCSRCGRWAPVAELSHLHGRPEARCLRCKRERRLVPTKSHPQPDPAPAHRLGALLAYARRAGLPFDESFGDAVGVVCADLPPRERESWASVFGETADAWEAGWDRRDRSASLAEALVLLEDEPAARIDVLALG